MLCPSNPEWEDSASSSEHLRTQGHCHLRVRARLCHPRPQSGAVPAEQHLAAPSAHLRARQVAGQHCRCHPAPVSPNPLIRCWLVSPTAGCRAPPRLVFAELKEPYRNQTAFPVGGTVEYTCQPGYARHVGMSPTITCLGNQSWSVALEFCKSASCMCCWEIHTS